ncbi:MAG: DUF58 domain-containing protein [Gemmataceae bacterium]|nr:DUF58 domain-containing protein [Gemmataceae bacterium]
MADDPRKYLDPRTLAKVRSLELKARLIVEGYLSGQHKSPYHGFSVEFAQHREYVAGDDIKHIDWKVWGRTGRFFLKQYEEETNLVCWIMLDLSESMKYGSIDGMSKYDYACMSAAALAYLVLSQSDAVGFVTFDSAVRHFIKPSSQMSQLKEMVHIMNQGVGGQKSNMAPLFHDMAERVKRRAIIFLISDMFEDLDPILSGLKHLRHKRHEVVLWNVLDGEELTFPFQESTLFRGMEAYPDLLTDPRALREGYLAQIEGFLKDLRRGCRDQNVDYVQLRTDTPLSVAMSSYMAHRAKRAR